MNTVHLDRCPICKSNDLEGMFDCKDYLTSSEIFSLCRCKSCGFGFTQDFPNSSSIGKYYEADEYISHTDTKKGILNRLYHNARNIALKNKVKLIKSYTSEQSNTLLDIGCGTGYFLDAMVREKWSVVGIEKSEVVRNQVKEKFGFDVHDSEYLSLLPTASQDAISLWHVLEHIENLDETMTNLERVLKQDGTLFIALPNKQSIDARHYKAYWAAYDVPRHLWHFSPSDFEKLAQKYGFSLIKQKMMYFDPFYISMLSEKYRGTTFASIVGLIKGAYFCFRSIFNVSHSSSVIYILKKQEIL